MDWILEQQFERALEANPIIMGVYWARGQEDEASRLKRCVVALCRQQEKIREILGASHEAGVNKAGLCPQVQRW